MFGGCFTRYFFKSTVETGFAVEAAHISNIQDGALFIAFIFQLSLNVADAVFFNKGEEVLVKGFIKGVGEQQLFNAGQLTQFFHGQLGIKIPIAGNIKKGQRISISAALFKYSGFLSKLIITRVLFQIDLAG